MIMKVREVVARFEPYVWELSSEDLKKKYDLERVLRFDTNTSPYALDIVKKALSSGTSQINEYPDPSYAALAGKIANYASVNPEQLVLGAGADEIIDVISKTFIGNGDKAVISTPTYSMFKICVSSMGGIPIQIERSKDFSLDCNILAEVANKNAAKLLFICNPNSPTGNLSRLEELENLLKATSSVVVVDEAYGEFSGPEASMIPFTSKYTNLIVIRTLSKAFGLAGARVGYAVSSPELVVQMNKVRPPNSISAVSISLAEAALSDDGIAEMRENVQRISAERDKLAAEFSALGLLVFPSACNFLLVKFPKGNASEVYEKLLARGIVVRNFSSKPGLEGCLRITVRSPEENEALLTELRMVV